MTGEDVPGEAAYYHAANRNKKSITVDIASTAGQNLLHRIVKDADVVVENFQAGKLARYRLGYEDLSAIRPSLVYASITGFGQTVRRPHACRRQPQGTDGPANLGLTRGQPRSLPAAGMGHPGAAQRRARLRLCYPGNDGLHVGHRRPKRPAAKGRRRHRRPYDGPVHLNRHPRGAADRTTDRTYAASVCRLERECTSWSSWPSMTF